jgi:4-hydroxyphenylacetate 3-monooxygenase
MDRADRGGSEVALGRTVPFTGEEYLDSLRDGRDVWIDGERVADVTAHPAFRNAARSVARLYDAMHDPATRDLLTAEDRLGIRTHRFFMPSYSAGDLLASREAIAHWSRMSYGHMGRTPDYKASFMATLGADPEWYEPFAESGRRWYREYAEKALFLNHVLINPPIDRDKAVHEVEDVYVHVVREHDDGIVVSGAKMLATGSAITHATFVAQNSAVQLEEGKAEDYALVFIAPMDTPGKKLICRNSYEAAARSPWDNPLSSRFDENDAVVIFDDAFIPWENVLVYRDVKKVTGFYASSGFMPRYTLQSGTRLAVKLDFLCALLARGLRANGTDGFRGVQAKLGELVGWRNLIWALTAALCHEPMPGPGESVVPKLEYATLIRLFGTQAVPQARDLRRDPRRRAARDAVERARSAERRAAPADRPLLPRLDRRRARPHEAVQADLGRGRHRVRRPPRVVRDQLQRQPGADAPGHAALLGVRGITGAADELVEQCLSEYDLDGWTGGAWIAE